MNHRDIINRLLEGNERYVTDRLSRPHCSAARRIETAGGQKPFAVVLGCSDSRVPPELLFDQGVGDLFVIRVAGNVLDDIVMASIEYAVSHLSVPLVMVLGHSSCGAVTAAVRGATDEGHLGSLGEALRSAVAAVSEDSSDPVLDAIKANVRNSVQTLKECGPILSSRVHSGAIQIVPALYELETGRVTLL